MIQKTYINSRNPKAHFIMSKPVFLARELARSCTNITYPEQLFFNVEHTQTKWQS